VAPEGPTRTPSHASCAWIRDAPYVPRELACSVRMRGSSCASLGVRIAGSRTSMYYLLPSAGTQSRGWIAEANHAERRHGHPGRKCLLETLRYASRNFFLKLESTGPAGMKRRSVRKSDASPVGVCRMRHAPSAASTMVAATPSGSGAAWTVLTTA